MVIRANIIEAGEKKTENSDASHSGQSAIDKEDIIKECVAIVMELLNNKNQR